MSPILRKLLLASLLAACACRKTPGPPSVEWERAHALHVDLVGRYADDAYGRPEIEQVLALLAQVPSDSIDAAEAAALRARILEARQQLAAQQAERQRLLSAAGPAAWSPSAGESNPGAGGGPAPAAIPGPPPLAPGLARDAFLQAYGECFEPRMQMRLENPDGGTLTENGEGFILKPDAGCRERYPQLAEQTVVFGDGKLVSIRSAAEMKAALKTVELKTVGPPVEIQVEAEVGPDGGLVPKRGPDGGYIPVKDGGP